MPEETLPDISSLDDNSFLETVNSTEFIESMSPSSGAEQESESHSDAESDGDIADLDSSEQESEYSDDPEAPDDDENADLDGEEDNDSDPGTDADGDSDSDIKSDESDDTDPLTASVLAPLSLNGQEFQVRSVDEARKLMQMGLNSSGTASGAPSPLLHMLQQHELTDPSQLSFLIDLAKHDKGAIGKLLKDAGIDPLDLEAEPAEYTPNDYTPDARRMALDQAVDSIRGTETFNKTMEVVTKTWDDSSRQVISDNPQILGVLNQHMADGTFDLVNQEITRIRMFGGLAGVSNIEAYRTVGDQLFAKGGDNAATTPPTVKTQPKAQSDQNRSRKKAASSPRKSAKSKGGRKEVNPLTLSDEEFERRFMQ